MIWIPLAILRSVITSGLILFQKLDKTDKTDKFLFPTITTIIIGFIALIYYIFNYNINPFVYHSDIWNVTYEFH